MNLLYMTFAYLPALCRSYQHIGFKDININLTLPNSVAQGVISYVNCPHVEYAVIHGTPFEAKRGSCLISSITAYSSFITSGLDGGSEIGSARCAQFYFGNPGTQFSQFEILLSGGSTHSCRVVHKTDPSDDITLLDQYNALYTRLIAGPPSGTIVIKNDLAQTVSGKITFMEPSLLCDFPLNYTVPANESSKPLPIGDCLITTITGKTSDMVCINFNSPGSSQPTFTIRDTMDGYECEIIANRT